MPNDTIRDLILKGMADREILNVARRAGMKTIFEDGIDKVLQGLITIEEVTRVVAPPRAPSEEEKTTVGEQVRMKKALVVEDHPDTLQLITLQLLMLGFAVVSANNGKEGVEKAIEEKPQLILMDILMPGMDGRDATRMIRSNQKTKDIPILASTVLTGELELKSCIEAGCNDFLIKPFTMEQLQGKVQEFIPSSSPTIH
jgi:CheY-like chemotaxis protein